MYLKNGNMIVASNINEVPLHDIKPTQHLILLGSNEVGFYGREVETSTSMVCTSVQSDILWVLDCNGSYVTYDNCDESSEFEDIQLETRNFYRTYLNLGNELYNLGDSDRWELRYHIDQFGEDEEIRNDIDKQIHEKVFRNQHSKNWFGQTYNERTKVTYLPVEISEDVCLIFSISSSFFHFKKWDIFLKISVLQKKSNEVITLKTDFRDLYNRVKKMKSDYLTKDDFEKFDEILELIKYDIKQHIESSEKDKTLMIDKLMGISQPTIYRNQLEKLFSFFYENNDLGIKIYIDSVKSYHSNYLLYKDDEYIWSYDYSPEMKIEILKAGAIYTWDDGNVRTGIEPRTGLYHENGQVSLKPSDFYEDAGGIVYFNNGRRICYINYDDIFVKTEENTQLIKELLERKEMVERITSA